MKGLSEFGKGCDKIGKHYWCRDCVSKHGYGQLTGVEGVDFVVCPLCNKRLKQITGFHLRRAHGITTEEFKEHFPGVELQSEMTKKKFYEKGERHRNDPDFARRIKDGVNTPEAKQKKREALKGHEVTQETRDKIAQTLKAKPKKRVPFTCEYCGETKEVQPWYARTHKYCSNECRLAAITGTSRSQEFCDKMKEIKQAQYQDPIFAARMAKIQHKVQKEAQGRPEVVAKKREATTRNWQNPEFRAKVLAGQYHRPTKPELELKQILDEHFPGQFEYVGDGSWWRSVKDKDGKLHNLNPDFISINGERLIIEMFGDYWHGKEGKKRYNMMDENTRRILFASINYKMLVIWEHELKEPDKVVQRIRGFIKGGIV